jgi:hypothetical protein
LPSVVIELRAAGVLRHSVPTAQNASA